MRRNTRMWIPGAVAVCVLRGAGADRMRAKRQWAEMITWPPLPGDPRYVGVVASIRLACETRDWAEQSGTEF